MTVPASITAEVFLELVDRHLTPVMETQGYVFCGGGEGRATTGPTLLTRSRRWHRPRWLRRMSPRSRQRLERELSAGYEGKGVDDERWVSYYPTRQDLDLSQLHAAWPSERLTVAATPDDIEKSLQTAAAHIREHGLRD